METIQIEQIRHDLTWRIRHEAMYPDQSFDVIKLNNDVNGIHFGLFSKDQLTTVISLFEENEEIWQFRKFATLPNAQGKGYGTLMLNHIIQFVKDQKGSKLWCNARRSVSPFYKAFGFYKTEKCYTQHGIEFVIMELQLH